MTKMITLFGREPRELRFNDLKRERRCQTWLLTRIKMLLKQEYKNLEKSDTQIRQDKVAFLEMYKQHLEALIQECDFCLERKFEPLSNAYAKRPQYSIRARNDKVRQRIANDAHLRADYLKAVQEGLNVSWDRDKFFLVATDRGYQTEEAVTAAVAKELGISLQRAKLGLNHGRFTWGQVLVLGAFMQMTPKEFCDIFLAGYFTEQWGEYRADMDTINKVELLKRVTRDRDPIEDMDVVEVGADGKPIDEEVWF